jgi:hypothetical protein
VDGGSIIEVLKDVLNHPQLALAALNLLAVLPDPSLDVEARGVMCVALKVEHQVSKFADTLYRQLHFLIAKVNI